jgi:hypothetical protein
VFTFSNVSNARILITIFSQMFSKPHLCECFNFRSCIFKINMKKNTVKYLQGINCSQLTVAGNTEIKNLGRTTTDLVAPQSSSSRIQTCVRIFNRAIYAKHKWLSGCTERNALLGLLINHTIIILAQILP